MEREIVGRLVGLITIDALAFRSAPDRAGEGLPQDASLGSTLACLALGCHDATSGARRGAVPGIRTGEPAEARFSATRFDSRLAGRWKSPERISANLDHLASELKLALVQVRRKIAKVSGAVA